MANKRCKAVQIYSEIQTKLGGMAKMNEITMKVLVSEILAKMLTEHKNEVEEIIKEIKILKKD